MPSLRYALPLLVIASTSAVQADVRGWHRVGEIGGPVLWIAGLGSSLLQDGDKGKAHAARTLDGFLATGALTEGLKLLIKEQRPYGTDRDSLPSLHSSLSFEIVAAQSYYHPKQAPFWYGAAAAIGYARVAGHDHFVQDVAVGALIGYEVGQLAVKSKKGWFIAPAYEGGHVGLTILYSPGI